MFQYSIPLKHLQHKGKLLHKGISLKFNWFWSIYDSYQNHNSAILEKFEAGGDHLSASDDVIQYLLLEAYKDQIEEYIDEIQVII